jgi:hypothetical protein
MRREGGFYLEAGNPKTAIILKTATGAKSATEENEV